MKKLISYVFTFVMIFTAIFGAISIDTSAATGNIVIVIDPGHGGEGDRNLGAQYNGLSEKALTLQVANALKAELERSLGCLSGSSSGFGLKNVIFLAFGSHLTIEILGLKNI